MRITIAQRFRPFSHFPGEMSMIPGTLLSVQAFPALAVVYDLSAPEPKEVARHTCNVQGPVEGFTVQQDLEKGCVRVWGHARNGFFRYHLCKAKDAYAFVVEKSSAEIALVGYGIPEYPCISAERLSLGIDKKQDWILVRKRMALAEILPFWLRLGSITPSVSEGGGGTAALLQKESLLELFMTGFGGILCPHLQDTFHQGVALPPISAAQSSGSLLSEGAALIRSLFFQEKKSAIHLLPEVPHAFHAGRFVNVSCRDGSEADIEWRSRKLRRVVFRCNKTGPCSFLLPAGLTSFRLRHNRNERGERCRTGESFETVAGQVYYIDRLES